MRRARKIGRPTNTTISTPVSRQRLYTRQNLLAAVQRNLRPMAAAHKQHLKVMLKHIHAIHRNPASYRLGFKKPARVSLTQLPRKPAGLHKEASGFWDVLKKGYNWVKKKFKKHGAVVMTHAKKHAVKVGSRVASRVGKTASRVGGRVLDQLERVAEQNIEHYTTAAENKIGALGKRATDKLKKWEKKKPDGMPGKSHRKK